MIASAETPPSCCCQDPWRTGAAPAVHGTSETHALRRGRLPLASALGFSFTIRGLLGLRLALPCSTYYVAGAGSTAAPQCAAPRQWRRGWVSSHGLRPPWRSRFLRSCEMCDIALVCATRRDGRAEGCGHRPPVIRAGECASTTLTRVLQPLKCRQPGMRTEELVCKRHEPID